MFIESIDRYIKVIKNNNINNEAEPLEDPYWPRHEKRYTDEITKNDRA